MRNCCKTILLLYFLAIYIVDVSYVLMAVMPKH